MIVCPVCEHQQLQGAECEVCGKRLRVHPLQGGPSVPLLDGFEPTLRPATAPPSSGGLPDLEATHHAAAPDFFEATPGLEATRVAPVDVDAAPLTELERTATAIPGDSPTELPAVQTCRYCRTPALSGERMCARCGMRLPDLASAPADPAPEHRLCSCGTPLRGGFCPSCGARSG